MEKLLENTFYLLALLNPASKVLFLATYKPQLNSKQNFELAWKSSLAALFILATLAFAGNFILEKIFHVNLYSLQITGGLIVFLIGLSAVRDGKFIQKKSDDVNNNFTEISLVPLAAPLIAGPGMIASVIANGIEHGLLITVLALTLAIIINFIFMLFSNTINKILTATHLLGSLIRLTGLIIAAVAMQMMITGFASCVKDIFQR